MRTPSGMRWCGINAPDSTNDGMMKNGVMNTACADERAIVEISTPIPSEQRMYGSATNRSASQLPSRPEIKDDPGKDRRDQQHHVAEHHVRRELAEHDLDRAGRLREHLLVRAALALADETEAREAHAEIREKQPAEHAEEEHVIGEGGVEAVMAADLDRRPGSAIGDAMNFDLARDRADDSRDARGRERIRTVDEKLRLRATALGRSREVRRHDEKRERASTPEALASFLVARHWLGLAEVSARRDVADEPAR